MKILERKIRANIEIRITDKNKKVSRTISIYDEDHDADWFREKIRMELDDEAMQNKSADRTIAIARKVLARK